MKWLNPLIFVGIALFIMFWSQLIPLVIILIIGYLVYTSIQKKSSKNSILDLFNNIRTTDSGRIFVKNQKEQIFKHFNQKSMINFNFKFLVTALLIISVVLIWIDWIVNVPAGEVAVIFDRWRWVLKTTYWEWMHLKIPFWQKATKMNTRIQIYTMSISPTEARNYWGEAVDALTEDGQKVMIDLTVQFHLEKENAPSVYQKIGLDYVAKIIRPAARSITREIITGYNSKDLFHIEKRQEVQVKIEEKLQTNLETKKLKLDGILLRNVKFSDIYIGAIEEKQIAEQKIQKAEFERQEALKIKERKIIEAEAEAESIRLKWEALSANKEIIQLEMINKLSPNIKWGVLPDGVMPLLDLKSMQ